MCVTINRISDGVRRLETAKVQKPENRKKKRKSEQMKEQNTEPVYGFLGAGNMASAIIGGIGGKNVCVYDVNPAQYE